MITRRRMLALLAGSASSAFAQGVSSRGVKPQPRGKPSGRPFHSRLTDVAAEAGLRHPIVYGGVDSKSYILEVVGCGVAFFDYDNDGWLDLLVLSGTRLEGAPPGTTNRLYKNNRDGTFTDVTEKAGLDPHGLGLGGHGGRLRQRRLRRPVHHLLRPERALPQQRRRHLHGRDGEGRPRRAARPLRLRLHLGGLRPRRPPGPVRRLLPRHDAGEAAPARREPRLPLEGRARELRPARPAHRLRPALPQQRRRDVHRRERAVRASPPPRGRIR